MSFYFTTFLIEVQNEYADLKEQAKQFDEDELYPEKYKIRPQVERDTISNLHKIYGNSFSMDMFDNVKSETDKAIDEAKNYSVRKRLEQYRLQRKAEQSADHYISHDDEGEWEL